MTQDQESESGRRQMTEMPSITEVCLKFHCKETIRYNVLFSFFRFFILTANNIKGCITVTLDVECLKW